MGWFRYACPEHGEFRLSLAERKKRMPCPQCSKESRSILGAGTARIMEVLDNGAMARRVERLHNVEEIMEERSRNHGPKEDE